MGGYKPATSGLGMYPSTKGSHKPHPNKNALYNSETGTMMGRSLLSWLKLITFYIIFYAGLVSFSFLLYNIFNLTISVDEPKYQLDSSLIGKNPGLGYRPMPDRDKNPDSTLVWFKRSNDIKNPNLLFWTGQLGRYLAKIETGNSTAGSKDLITCTEHNGRKATDKKACRVNYEIFGDCTQNDGYGYHRGEPCILIKLNKIYAWEPGSYGYRENGAFDPQLLVQDLDHEVATKKMPMSLRNTILEEVRNITIDPEILQKETRLKSLLSRVWIQCDGENAADVENIGARIYYPKAAIEGFYFPYKKQRGYQAPFVFVRFQQLTPGVVIHVECRAFAKNIRPDKLLRQGSVHFELLMD